MKAKTCNCFWKYFRIGFLLMRTILCCLVVGNVVYLFLMHEVLAALGLLVVGFSEAAILSLLYVIKYGYFLNYRSSSV